jgi:hypothetical protein
MIGKDWERDCDQSGSNLRLYLNRVSKTLKLEVKR